MAIAPLPKKEIKKTGMDLIDLHQRVLLHYFLSAGLSYRGRKKFFALYDHYINYKNISDYFHLPCKVFVRALVLDQLDKIKSYRRWRDYIKDYPRPKKTRARKSKRK